MLFVPWLHRKSPHRKSPHLNRQIRGNPAMNLQIGMHMAPSQQIGQWFGSYWPMPPNCVKRYRFTTQKVRPAGSMVRGVDRFVMSQRWKSVHCIPMTKKVPCTLKLKCNSVSSPVSKWRCQLVTQQGVMESYSYKWVLQPASQLKWAESRHRRHHHFVLIFNFYLYV